MAHPSIPMSANREAYSSSTVDRITASVGREELQSALRKVEPILGDRPERRYLRIEAGTGLSVSATDHEQLVTASVDAEVTEPGSVVAYGRYLIEFVKRAPEGPIAIQTVGHELQAEAGGARMALSIFEPNVWPHFNHLEGSGVAWNLASLKSVGRVLHAACHDGGRPALQGVCFRDGWAVATDGHQLAAVQVSLPNEASAVIPRAALETILRVTGDEDVYVRFGDHKATFVEGRVSLTTTLIEAEFPDWKQAVPPAAPQGISANREEFLQALERIAFLSQRDDHCALRLHPAEGGLQLEARVADVGHQEDFIAGENSVGDVCLQGRHLRNLLEQLTGDTVTLAMAAPLQAAVVREDGFIGLLMPIRV